MNYPMQVRESSPQQQIQHELSYFEKQKLQSQQKIIDNYMVESSVPSNTMQTPTSHPTSQSDLISSLNKQSKHGKGGKKEQVLRAEISELDDEIENL